MNQISLDMSAGGQSATYIQMCRFFEHKVKFEIKSDSYQFQSYARAYVWSPVELKWNLVASIHHGVMKTETGLAYKPHCRNGKPLASDFAIDREELVRRVTEILT